MRATLRYTLVRAPRSGKLRSPPSGEWLRAGGHAPGEGVRVLDDRDAVPEAHRAAHRGRAHLRSNAQGTPWQPSRL